MHSEALGLFPNVCSGDPGAGGGTEPGVHLPKWDGGGGSRACCAADVIAVKCAERLISQPATCSPEQAHSSNQGKGCRDLSRPG